jgi:hypothetical protein
VSTHLFLIESYLSPHLSRVSAFEGTENDALVVAMDQVGVLSACYLQLLIMPLKIVSTIKLMAENTQIAFEEVMNVDLGPVMIAIARRIARCFGDSGQRLKIKYCNLCESIACRSDNISLRIDSATRHEILDFVVQWMTPPKVCVVSALMSSC